MASYKNASSKRVNESRNKDHKALSRWSFGQKCHGAKRRVHKILTLCDFFFFFIKEVLNFRPLSVFIIAQ